MWWILKNEAIWSRRRVGMIRMIHIDKRKKELGVIPLMICLIIRRGEEPRRWTGHAHTFAWCTYTRSVLGFKEMKETEAADVDEWSWWIRHPSWSIPERPFFTIAGVVINRSFFLFRPAIFDAVMRPRARLRTNVEFTARSRENHELRNRVLTSWNCEERSEAWCDLHIHLISRHSRRRLDRTTVRFAMEMLPFFGSKEGRKK